MATLLDLAPASHTVTVRGLAVDVCGVSAAGLAVILRRFPDLLKALTAGGGVSLADLSEHGPDVVAAIIAAGTGSAGNAKAEAVAATLSVAEQAALLEAVVEATFPASGGGIEGFVNRVARVLSAGGDPAKAAVTG